MSNEVHQNKIRSGRKAGGNLVTPILEATQQHSEVVRRNNLMTSNVDDNGPISVRHNSAEPSRKRTRSSRQYGDHKRDCRGIAGSAYTSLASIEELVDESQPNFEPYRQQRSQQITTSLVEASLVSPHNDSNDYIDQHVHGGTDTNGISSSAMAHGTLNRVTKGLTTNGYTVNGNGVSTSALETLPSTLQVTKQSPTMETQKQTVHKVSVNGDLGTARMRTANAEPKGPRSKQFESFSVSYGSDGGNSIGVRISTETIELKQSRQNSSADQIPEKTQETLQNMKQQGRQSAMPKSASCYKNGSYSYVQSSLRNDIHDSHSVKVIDFRSDTCSLPTEGMKDAIYRAEVGDAVYGEDPSVLALEKKSAKLFQKEAACFLPSGTMSNLVAILVHCNKRGSEIITGSKSHILLLEQAGVAQFGGINIREIQNNPDGTFSLEELKTKIRVEDAHTPYTSLICVENTHNVLGGKVLPQHWVDELCAYAKSVNLPVHMDGARVFSASAKLKIPVCEITRNVDTATFCVSKNLGAPYGAVLLGSKEFITKARRVMKALGGGVRQVGFMAAAGLYALENMVERLPEDHYHVQMIANAIRELNNPHVKVLEPEDIHSNILMIRLNSSRITPIEFVTMLSTIHDDEEDPVMIKSFAMDRENVRFVLCTNNSKSDVEDAIRKVRFVVNKIA